MANNSPTIVAASLSDDQLKKSIDSLVTHVDEAMKKMVQSTNKAVGEMEAKLKSLGNIRIDTGSTSDGGSSKRTKKQQEETQAVKETASAHKELVMTLDQEAAAIQKASGRKKGIDYISLPSDVDKSVTYLINANKDVDTQMAAILQKESALVAEKQKETQATEQAAQATRMSGEELRKIYEDQKKVNEEINRRANGIRTGGTTPFQSYDSLRQSIAAVLGIQEQQVKMADTETDAYKKLSSTLNHLKQAYDLLGKSDRDSDQGKALVASIHEVERAMQKIRAQAARPVSLESIIGINEKGGLSEKTLDDIAYKMQRLASYRSGLDVDTQKEEISTVNAHYDRLKKKMDEVMQKNQSMIASNNALGRSWNYMKNRLAFYFTVGASTQFIKNLIEVRSQYEMNERALGILINSAERGTQIFNELSQMALVSPYTLIELSAAAKQLTAYDIAARDVVDTTRRLADMASAVGVPIERLTYALGQIKAYGYLNSRDARMFANAGIPLVKQLSDYYTELEGKMVSTADVYDRMKKKAIDYNSVMAVVTKMTDEGGKFFDFQAKMADTLKVRLANLTLAWNNMLNDMGKETQGVLTWSIGALRSLFLQWKNLYGALNEVSLVFGVAKALQFLGVCAHAAGVGFGSLNKYMTLNALLGTRLATTVRTLGNAFMSLVRSPLAWFTMAALLVTEIGDAFINADRATKEFNESLRDGAKTTYEDLKKFAEQYKNIRDSLYTTQKTAIGNIYDPSTGKAAATAYANQTVGQDISASEAKKVWEAMREQIELSSHASDEYISKLLSIENVSERLRQGFQILDDIQTVSAALKDIGDDGIKVTQGWAAWWNAWQGADGLIGNVKDLQEEIQRLKNAGQDPNDKFTKVIDKDYATALERFRKDLKVTTDSVIDFINLNGWSGDTGKIDEVFKQVTDRLATQSNLDPQTAFTLQREVEIARAKAAKEALEIRIADEKNALSAASDEISKQQIQKNLETLEQQKRDFDKFNGENRAYWNDFTKYIKERHISELTAAYNSMTDHGKKAMDFQSEEWQKYVHDWANRYEKSHNLATDSVFNRLRNWINDANTWSVFIKMTISTEDGKSVYKQLEEYDKAADDAWKTMQRLDKRISQLRKKGAKEVEGAETGAIDLSRVSQDDKELTEALKERTQAQKDYNDAVEKGGESKKENAAASKAQKQAESELAKALKDELKLIETVRSAYKDRVKEGMSHADAVAKSVSGYEKSVTNINKVLEKYGIKLDLTKFAGIANPHELQEMLNQQLNALAGKAKPTEIQALEVELKKVDLDVDKYDLTKITKGLNNELDRLKEEYELAVALDADPELGSMFADWMGVDMSELPKTASEYAEKATSILNKKLGELGSKTELPNLLNITDDDMRAFEANKTFKDAQLELVKKAVETARGFQRKETEDRIKDWDRLLEKYAEYEVKVNKIHNDAVKERVTFAQQFGSEEDKSLALNLQTQILAATDPQEKQKLIQQLQELVKSIAGDDKTKVNLITSIDNSEQQGVAKADFEEFQKSPEWITATGDLAGMTTKAIGYLINSLERYKKTAKNLDPKQIKQINSALRNLHRQQRQGNPFLQIADAIDRAKARAEEFQPEMDAVMSDIIALEKEIGDNDPTEEQAKHLQSLKDKWKDLAAQGEVSATEYVDAINSSIAAASQAIGMFADMAEALGGKHMTQAAQTIKDVTGVLEKAGQGAAMGAQVGGGWGALIGGVAGGLTGVITTFAEQWSGNKAITDSIKDSEKAVRQLELTMKSLEHTSDDAFGAIVVGSKQSIKATKELQLAELRRQLALEQSRSSKYKDEERISELQGQILDLEYEVKHATSEIVNDLLGISSHEDFFEGLISDMINAFKSGEDAMKVFSEKWAEMIDSMVVKMILGQVLQQWVNNLESGAAKIVDKYTKSLSEQVAEQENVIQGMQSMDAGDITKTLYYTQRDLFDKIINQLGVEAPKEGWATEVLWFEEAWQSGISQKISDVYMEMLKNGIGSLQDQISKKSLDATEELIEYYTQEGKVFGDQIKDIWPQLMEQFGYKYGQDADAGLSALQQGIQGITEDTAGAIEAYMNGVSQQVYYQSDILTQIRDILIGGDADIQLGVQGQMLLQLQQSFQVQMAIQGILEGVLTPSGQGFRVELLS